jgi:hypothetical protein
MVHGCRVRLVWCLVQQGSEAEEFTGGGSIYDDFLLILIDGCDVYGARDQDIRCA